MGRRMRAVVRVWVFLVAWVGGYVALSLPAVLLDTLSGLRLQYRPAPLNLFTLTLALAAVPAALLAWWLPRWLERAGRRPPA